MAKTKGAMANINGKVFEDVMIPIFQKNGFPVIPESKFIKCKTKYKDVTKCVLKNAAFKSIYGHTGHTEFVIVDATRRIRIEAKFQASSGSVDEKFPYMIANIAQYPEDEIIFVVDGGGYKACAREWLQKTIEENAEEYQTTYNKTVKLMNFTELINWFNHEFA